MHPLAYSGPAPSALAWAVLLPAGCPYLSRGGAEVGVPPAADAGVLAVVARVGTCQAGTDCSMLAKPDPLVIRSTAALSIDTNRDYPTRPLELTRVVELCPHRSGPIRTGQY